MNCMGTKILLAGWIELHMECIPSVDLFRNCTIHLFDVFINNSHQRSNIPFLEGSGA